MIFENKKYDFIDFGASKGSSIEYAKKSLNGNQGLGIDINPSKVSHMKTFGYDCILGDITNLEYIPDNSVRFVTISHVLEHLPNIAEIKKTIEEAIRISTDFVFIQGPYFDADDYLETLNLKFFWSDWRGHPYHFRTDEMEDIAFKNDSIFKHKILVREPVRDSLDPTIHPLESPIDQHEYVKALHPQKNIIKFEIPVYKEFVTYIAIRKLRYWEFLISSKSNCYEINGNKLKTNLNVMSILWKQYVILKWLLTVDIRKLINYFYKYIRKLALKIRLL